MYDITNYTKNKAKSLGVIVKPSTNKNKKIDVFRKDKKIASIGQANAMDYPHYIKEKGIEYANERRRLYNIRHAKTSKVIGSPSYFSKNLLW